MSAPGPSRVPPGPPPGRPPMAMGRPPGPPPGGPGMPFGGGVPVVGFPGYAAPMRPMMMPPPNIMRAFPPLPPGWTEHRAPDGVTPYYYNPTTKESTYTRPLAPPAAGGADKASKEKKKKEKPKDKVPVPGTSWTRVTTNEGNVFYFEKESKRSEWTVPAEIKEAVEELEVSEQRERAEKEEEARLERLREQERIRAEVEEERRRNMQKAEERKRKATEDAEAARQAKVARAAQADAGELNKEGEDEDGERGEVEGGGEEDGEELGPQDEEDEAEWMKAVAAEFAEADKAAEEEREREKEENERKEEEAAKQVFAVPQKVSVSPEEGRALFKALLIEKKISPFSPWDQSLPLFINDPRYVLLSSMKERQEVFDEYCRDVGRARRLNKASTSSSTTAGSGSAQAGAGGDKKKVDPEKEYRTLLREDVTSTRTRWDDFRKKWKKDRRFYAFGRDDREREKAFKVHLRELGERKRADAQRAETDFFELLTETEIAAGSSWSQVKRGISSDPRYDAVGSSSLREELFKSHMKKVEQAAEVANETPEEAAARKVRERKEREAASLRERQAKVQEVQAKVSADVDRSRAGASREEAERLYGSLLVDVIRDHDTTWQMALPILEQDPRFNNPALRPGDKQRLFSDHISRISSKRSNALHTLFSTHTPALDTSFDAVYPLIIDDPLVARLGLGADNAGALEDRWRAWQRSREAEARTEFDQMLGENKFVEFWGRLRKKTIDDADAKYAGEDTVHVEDVDDVGGEDADRNVDMIALAQKIDLDEIKSVLRRDKRYRQFDHIPDVREQWLRDFLGNLEATKGTQTIHNVGGY